MIPTVAIIFLLMVCEASGVTAWSEEVTVTTPRDFTSPNPPAGLVISRGDRRLILNWEMNTEDDICRYRIYRSHSPGVSTSESPLASVSECQYTDTGLSPGERYYYVVTAVDMTHCQDPPPADPNAQSGPSNEVDEVVIEIPYDGVDIGGASPAGSFVGDGCPMTVTGGGGDIWESSDQFYYVYQPTAGDTEMETKILSQQNTNDWAKAGVMFRETLDPGSKHAIMAITPSNGAVFQRRTSTDGASENTQAAAAAPVCVKLARNGNVFTGWISTDDGDIWSEVGSVTIDMADSYYIGYAVTSHVQGSGCTVTFDCCGQTCPDKVPAAPGTLVITDSTATACHLSWTDQSGENCDAANEFKIERATEGGSFEVIATVSMTSYTDTGLAYGSSYQYRVLAVNSFGSSSASEVVSLPSREPSPPAPPAGLAATGNPSRISLDWDDNTETEPAVLYYIVYRAASAAGPFKAVAIAFGGSRITDSNVLGDTTYYYMVQAVDTWPHHSDFSEVVHAATHVPDPPTAPANLVGSPVGYQQINLGWTDRSDNESGFRILRNQAEIDTVGIDDTTYIDTGLSAGTTYQYKVIAYNDDGDSAEPNPTVSVTTESLEVPEPPSDLSAYTVSGTQIDLSWADNSLVDDHTEIERDGEIIQTVPVITSYSDTGLNNCTTYTYRVRACNDAGCSAWSNEVAATTGCNPVITRVDDADGSITYNGNWNAQSGWGGRYETTVHESSDLATPASAEITFTGVSIQLIGDKHQWGGTIDVYLDDQLELSDVSFHDPEGQLYQQVIFYIDNLTHTQHTLRIEKSGGDWIYIDAIEYVHY